MLVTSLYLLWWFIIFLATSNFLINGQALVIVLSVWLLIFQFLLTLLSVMCLGRISWMIQSQHFIWSHWKFPVTPFNKSTLDSLDKTFQSLDQNFDEQLDQFSSDISLIKETTTTTTNDILTYLAFTMALANLCLLIFFRCHFRFRRPPGTARLPAKIISTNPEQIELDSLPKCEDCHRPRCSSVWNSSVLCPVPCVLKCHLLSFYF